MDSADDIIAHLELQPHPEGGWYKETWRSTELAFGRPVGTAILFLLKQGERSHWHRVDADEVWLYHAGAPLILGISTDDDRAARECVLGPEVMSGDMPQRVVPANRWQAARSTGDWTLVSCTVSPGFQFEGFELAAPDFVLPILPPTGG